MKHWSWAGFVVAVLIGGFAAAQEDTETSRVPTRQLNGLNWMEVKEWVPQRFETALLPVGTMEAHGIVNNGADNTVPEAIARDLAERLNALIAPTIPYGVTTSLSGFAGSFPISPAVFREYSREVIAGLATVGFKNVIVLNGHGPNFEPLQEACAAVSETAGLRTLVVNWWTVTGDITKEVFGTDGGHAGVNETAAVLATNPEFVRADRYRPELAWWRQEGVAAYPFPSSIILYQPGEGYPVLDVEKSRVFYGKVLDRLEDLIATTLKKWAEM